MPERLHKPYGNQYPETQVDEAKRLDNHALAEGIIRQLGSDFSDEDSVWIAEWASPKLLMDFELVRELHEDSVVYELRTMDVVGKVEYIGFDTDTTAMSLTPGDEGVQVIYSPDEDPDFCRQLESSLGKYLRTAPIDHSKLPKNHLWSELFEDITIGLALEDAIALSYFKNNRYFTEQRAQRKFKQYLHKYFGLSESGIQRLYDTYQEQHPGGSHGHQA